MRRFHELDMDDPDDRQEAKDRYRKALHQAWEWAGDIFDHQKTDWFPTSHAAASLEYEPGDKPYRKYCFDMACNKDMAAAMFKLFRIAEGECGPVNAGWVRLVTMPGIPIGAIEFEFRTPPVPAKEEA